MGDVISTHLDESRRHQISVKTDKVLQEFCKFYEEQYGVALFNKVRYEIEGNGGPQAQLLHRKVSLEEGMIFSGNLFQYLEDNKKWRNRFCLVPHHYGVVLYESKMTYDRGMQPRVGINSAGYKVVTSIDQYVDLLNNSLPGGKSKSSSSQILKCATQFPIILWHPYARHYYFCVMTEKEHVKWTAVFQDCVRHCNNGISEDSKVEAPAFTDAVRMYRQSKEHYGTWDMLCGNEVQILSNLVMEDLIPELKNVISPKLKGKSHERQRAWLLISDTVYRMVQEQAKVRYDAIVGKCESIRSTMEGSIRTDMDQIITSKEHLANKIRACVFPKAEICVRNHVQPFIGSILEALMLPTSLGFTEVRDLFFKEVTEMNMNVVNEGGKEKLGEHMEKLSQLAYHPVKMQACYERMDSLKLDGLQQRFDVSSPAVFKQRAQIHMREQMDNAVYTFEQLLHQELGKSPDKEELCRGIQRVLERVLKKYDYDSSTIRKKFFREALLQIIIPFLLKKLAPTCKSDLPRFQELIFEDFSQFIMVENTYEEVVLQSVMKDIMQAVKEAAVQRKHNLYRDSMVLHNSDPNLHLLGDDVPIDWSKEYGDEPADAASAEKHRRAKQVVSLIHDDDGTLPYESCMEVPAHEDIREEPEAEQVSASIAEGEPKLLHSPDNVTEIRGMIVREIQLEIPVPVHDQTDVLPTNSSKVEEKTTSETSKDGSHALEVCQVPEPVTKAPAMEVCQAPEPVVKAPAVEVCQVPEPVAKASAVEVHEALEPVVKAPSLEVHLIPEPELTRKESEAQKPAEENLSTEASKTDELTLYSKETPSIYMERSNRDDSGFQSPMSEEGEEPAAPASPVKPPARDAVMFSDDSAHSHEYNHKKEAPIHVSTEQTKPV